MKDNNILGFETSEELENALQDARNKKEGAHCTLSASSGKIGTSADGKNIFSYTSIVFEDAGGQSFDLIEMYKNAIKTENIKEIEELTKLVDKALDIAGDDGKGTLSIFLKGMGSVLREKLPQNHMSLDNAKINEFLTNPNTLATIPWKDGFKELYAADINNPSLEVLEKFNFDKLERYSDNEIKLKLLLDVQLVGVNFYGAQANIDTTVPLPLAETLDFFGWKHETQEQRKWALKELKKIMSNVANIECLQVKIPNFEVQPSVRIGTDLTPSASWKNNAIYFPVSPIYARYVNAKHTNLTKIMSNIRDLKGAALRISLSLQRLFFDDKANSSFNNTVIGVKTLLKAAGGTIWSYKKVQERQPGRWNRFIRVKLENALDEIANAGIIEWNYREDVSSILTFEEYEKLHIEFEVLIKDKDRKERLERKAERIKNNEDNQNKKLVKVTEELVKEMRKTNQKKDNNSKKGE